MSIALYNNNSIACSKITTCNYSSSFSLGIKVLNKKFRNPIYAIYGFVRFADEIVDTFYDYNPREELLLFKEQTYKAIQTRFSSNPILHAFQWVVNQFNIDHALIDAFLYSMELDVTKKEYTQEEYKCYIYGSAEAVGLMCLKVFCKGEKQLYEKLTPYARSLGSAFQKVNFLRDIASDNKERGRVYFPGITLSNFSWPEKKVIEKDIKNDLHHAYTGIKMLDKDARLGVYMAYSYYKILLHKIEKIDPTKLLSARYRINNMQKILLIIICYCKNLLNML